MITSHFGLPIMKQKKVRLKRRVSGEVKRGLETLNGTTTQQGGANRCYLLYSKCRLLPKCSRPGRPSRGKAPSLASSNFDRCPHVLLRFPGIFSNCARRVLSPKMEVGAPCREFLSATLEPLGGFSVAGIDSVVALDTVATGNSDSSQWRNRRNTVLGEFGVPPAKPRPACARFKFRKGWMNEFRLAANAPAGIAVRRGEFPFLLEAHIPAMSCNGALQSAGGQLDLVRDILNLGRLGSGPSRQ